MHFARTTLEGAFLISPEPVSDHRGSFARTFCLREFEAHGLETQYVQHSLSANARKGTLRGMHLQREPHGEVKVVTCQAGAILDVILDMRPWSPTYRSWEAFELTAANRCRLYIPAGVAHGFQTLTDAAEVAYMMSAFFAPEAATGYRFDDPAFGIRWPLPVSAVSDKDLAWPPAEQAPAVAV